jgi:hypothetical protein
MPAALVIFARAAIIVTVSQWRSKTRRHRRRWSQPTKAVQSAVAALPNPLTCVAKEVTCHARSLGVAQCLADVLCVNILHFVTKSLRVWFFHLQIKHDVFALLHVPFERIEAAAEH